MTSIEYFFWAIAIIVLLFYVSVKIFPFVHPYYLRPDNVIGFVGGPGSGKTLSAVRIAVSKYKQALARYYVVRVIRVITPFLPWQMKQEKPLFFSNIPVEYAKGKFSLELTKEHLQGHYYLGGKGSVCLCDEVGAWFSVQNNKFKEFPDVAEADKLFRFYRHFTLNGFLVATEQSSDSINHVLRRRMSKLYYLNGFTKVIIPFLGIGLAWTNIFSFVNSESKVNYETHEKVEGSVQSNTRTAKRWFWFWGLLNPYPKYNSHYFYDLRPLKPKNKLYVSHKYKDNNK